MELKLIRRHSDDLPDDAPASNELHPRASSSKTHSGLAAIDPLADLADALATQGDVQTLLQTLRDIIGQVISFDTVSVMLHDPEKNVMCGYAVGTALRTSFRPGNEYALNDCPQGTVWQTQEPIQIADLRRDQRFAHSKRLMMESGLHSYWVLPLTTARKALGALAFGSRQPNAFDHCDAEAVLRVARIVAVSVESALNAAHATELLERTHQQRDRLKVLLDATNTLVSARSTDRLVAELSSSLKQALDHDTISLASYNSATQSFRVLAIDGPGKDEFTTHERIETKGTRFGLVFETGAPVCRTQLDPAEFPADALVGRIVASGIRSICSLPLQAHGRMLGVLSVGWRRAHAFSDDDVQLLMQVAQQTALAFDNAAYIDEARAEKEKLFEENRYLAEEIRTVHNFDEIVGNSAALRQVLDQVSIVAPTDSTVLIEGETGTGKELIARAIHDRSPRRERPLIKVNCAAIPAGLIESELFGHEKGAFTGAVAQRRGKFELANGGTIFLDEIGDMPRDMQVKLLRTLQEREIERVGSTKTIALDVRVIAATNADLMKKVADNEFRADLYYRLAVFPLRLPPLRERRGDINLLVNWFTQKLSRTMRKKIESVPADAMRALEGYAWPGNIRELENVIERAVILTQGPVLNVPLAALPSATRIPAGDDALEAVEREHILRVLMECKWLLSGPNGAATRLGLKRTTLQSRMERLGIARPS